MGRERVCPCMRAYACGEQRSKNGNVLFLLLLAAACEAQHLCECTIFAAAVSLAVPGDRE